MFLCNIWPRQTFYPIWAGSILEATGFAVLAWATRSRKSTIVSVMMAFAGAGTGLRFMPNTLHAVGIWPTRVASVMSLMDFALPFGGTLGIAIMSAVFYNKFSASLIADMAGNVSVNPHNTTSSLQGIDALPDSVQALVRDQAAHAVMWSFISILPIMGLSVIGATVLGNVWIKPRNPENEDEARGAVIYSSFLLALLTVCLRLVLFSFKLADKLRRVRSRIKRSRWIGDLILKSRKRRRQKMLLRNHRGLDVLF
jgi:hypothetical protein